MGISTAFLAMQWAARLVASFKEIWDAVAGSGLYSQTPLPLWLAMAGYIAICSLATALHWFVSFTLHETITWTYNCVIEIGFSWWGKKRYSHTNIDISTQYSFPYRIKIKSNQVIFIVTSPQHMCLSEWNSWEHTPDIEKTIYIKTVHT